MKTSKKWLGEYIDDNLPKTETLAREITMKAFEIDEIEPKKGDDILDIKVLPDRASDCLSHRGIAREISVILNLPFKDIEIKAVPNLSLNDFDISVESELCDRYVGRKIKNIKVVDSPEWLKEKLTSIGQKPINNVVDITNYVMYSLGQPMHAFDLAKVNGGLKVRMAKTGESITTLDKKEVALDEEILVIADSTTPLAIAGIKGGVFAEVNKDTKDILLESAHFDSGYISKTSRKIRIMTDSSKRFENSISKSMAGMAMDLATALVLEICGDSNTEVFESFDSNPKETEPRVIELSVEKINKHLGVDLSEEKVSEILAQFKYFKFEVNSGLFKVTIPVERVDLVLEENLIEEIGRIYGYDNLTNSPLPTYEKGVNPNKQYLTKQILIDELVDSGFSEVYTYSFSNTGDVEVANPISEDKKFLRNNLKTGIIDSLSKNTYNADLLGLIDSIKQFEIGNVFVGDREELRLGIAVAWRKKTKEAEKTFLKNLLSDIENKYKCSFKIVEESEFYIEIDISDLVFEDSILDSYMGDKIYSIEKYKQYSVFPFAVRDIAVFIEENDDPKVLEEIFNNNSEGLLVRIKEFDVFKKDNKVSYAYRLVFQSNEKTLTDEDINKIMDAINSEIASKGFEVR